jgi:hypothetical protein
MADDSQVNPHYLEHVLAASDTRGIEAAEDIVAGNGMKLLAKGARIDANMRERLLGYKLRKPLEESMRVSSGVTTSDMASVAESLIERHPMLEGIYAAGYDHVLKILRTLGFNNVLQSLLTIFIEHRPGKLEHAVGTALLCAGLHARVSPTDKGGLRPAMVAGLFHDVGELYIDPALFNKGAELTPEEWRHIAAHPLVAQRLLREAPGAGGEVTQAITQHHERLDGFGYPHGLRGDQIALESQVLAASEMLIGVLESGRTPLRRAAVAAKLIPGEFHGRIVDLVSNLCSQNREDVPAKMPSMAELKETAAGIAHALEQTRGIGRDLSGPCETGVPAVQNLFSQTMHRFERIQRAFSSTGMDAGNQAGMFEQLAALSEAEIQLEVSLVLGEIRWRLRELARELTVRTRSMRKQDAAMFEGLIAALRMEQK